MYVRLTISEKSGLKEYLQWRSYNMGFEKKKIKMTSQFSGERKMSKCFPFPTILGTVRVEWRWNHVSTTSQFRENLHIIIKITRILTLWQAQDRDARAEEKNCKEAKRIVETNIKNTHVLFEIDIL